MARRISGERSLKVGGKTYTLRLDFDALSAIEDRYGSIIKIITEFSDGQPKLSLLAFMFCHTARINQTKAYSLTMEFNSDVFTGMLEVISATLNPEKEKGSGSGE